MPSQLTSSHLNANNFANLLAFSLTNAMESSSNSARDPRRYACYSMRVSRTFSGDSEQCI